jgi:hypothetical protein
VLIASGSNQALATCECFFYPFLCGSFWRGAGVAELARLESVYTARYRGFESLSLRRSNHGPAIAGIFVLEPSPDASSRATARKQKCSERSEHHDWILASPLGITAGNPSLSAFARRSLDEGELRLKICLPLLSVSLRTGELRRTQSANSLAVALATVCAEAQRRSKASFA